MLNKVMLIGQLGTEPELRYTANGAGLCNFRLASSRKYDGKEVTEWFSVVAWNQLAEQCATHLAKGRTVYVEGRLQSRSWDGPDGQKRYRTEVVASNVIFLSKKGDAYEDDYPQTGFDGIDPDDLPFSD